MEINPDRKYAIFDLISEKGMQVKYF